MISKRILGRKDGKSSASDSLRYGAGLKIDRATGLYIDKAHRMRLSGYGLVQNGVYVNQQIEVISDVIALAALEMQSNCDLNRRVGFEKKIAHFIFGFDQQEPSEAVLRDVEDSALAVLNLDKNHFATFLHNDSGHWHLHVFASRIERDELHRGNSLWRDKTLRDKVCREVEIRHGLNRDNGLHKIDENGTIVEIPIEQRRENRGKKKEISGSAKNIEIITGEKSFQTFCNKIRIGERLRHATSWQDIHLAAAAYKCEIKAKGAGFVICPIGEKGGIQLSKVGLKSLAEKYGQFEVAKPNLLITVKDEYKPTPTKPAGTLYDKWKKARAEHGKLKLKEVYEFRETADRQRRGLREQQKRELAKIRSTGAGRVRASAISIKKMEHSAASTQLGTDIRAKRSALYKELAAVAPGATFRSYLQQQAQSGDDVALELARRYAMDDATDVSIQSEAIKFKIVGAISGTGTGSMTLLRASIRHCVEHNGTIIFDLGRGCIVTDSSISKKIQLNAAAAVDVESIETSLRFAVSKFGKSLTLSGSPAFQRLAVETAVLSGLNVEFTDQGLEEYRKNFKAITFHKEIRNVNHVRTNPPRTIQSTVQGDRLHSLSTRTVVPDTQDIKVLLPTDVFDRMGKPLAAKWGHRGLRWTANDRRRDGEIPAGGSDSSVGDNQGKGTTETALDSNVRVIEQVNYGYEQARSKRGIAISNKSRKGR